MIRGERVTGNRPRIVAASVASEPTGWDDPVWSTTRTYLLVNAWAAAPVRHPTRVRVVCAADALLLRYACQSDRISAEMTCYKDRVWTEGAVEAYLMPSGADWLYEFQVNAAGTRRDLRVDRPGTPRQVYAEEWECPGFAARTVVHTASDGGVRGWEALVRIPWSGVRERDGGDVVRDWRLGLFRWEHHPVEFSGLMCHPGVDAHDASFLAELT